jgi:biotin synthase-related radical SAM superfamily protein
MAKIKILKPITFEGVKQQTGNEIELSNERLAEMVENFKKQNLNGHLYIEVLEVDQEETQTKPKKTRNRKK